MATNSAIPTVILVVGGLLLADKVLSAFDDPQPGGDVDPAGGDDRPATFTTDDAAMIADLIQVAIWGDTYVADATEDEAAVVALMQLAQVTNDVLVLFNAYGDRGTVLHQLTLPETLAAYLERSDLDAINADYKTKGITTRF